MNRIVTAEWLHSELEKQSAAYVIVDTRFQLGNPDVGRVSYLEGHLPGAIYVDLEKDLSSAVSKHGGRHPLPNIDTLIAKFEKWGIGNESKLIVYDDQGGMFASRFWWLCHYLGHDDVAILDGGYSSWLEKGYDVITEIPVPSQKTFSLQVNDNEVLADAAYVKERLHNTETVLLDSRELARYLGKEEPIDPIAGHIPGAVHYFWKDVLDDKGNWKRKEELKKHFANIPQTKEVIVYCGSGVSACPNILALKEAGFSNVKLYSGSWSDWITYEDYPIE
ncbi:sulfurtransferase [Alkalihalobacillus sp. MEB130]|uniref:sulfurtransferase n=1 Tax=Alkalihalobacillus sp. MEB130 TaxID=2976704 RepID=UPI0028DE8F7C|nr:sulfurtransferase [Alkalihalobacillus sp. MEB130]MDT8861279.1 sulfurtransferase [Alkalihalobacillus sp. MEB130]